MTMGNSHAIWTESGERSNHTGFSHKTWTKSRGGGHVHEWARYCLIEMAAKGASLDELRDFCNEKGIPARRGKYWSTSTWNSLLQPHALLKFCGYDVWNVHRKNGSKRDSTEWTVVENAHPAIITEDEAKAVAAARQRQRKTSRRFDKGGKRSRGSRYLLSGGLFKCARCGQNMTGRRRDKDRYYYVCGSQPYRRGKGCGPGIYVPQEKVEHQVLEGLQDLLGVCTDPKGFTTKVNEELRRIWQESTGYDPNAEQKVQAIENKIAKVRQAIEDGLEDVAWANRRLRELAQERDELTAGAARPATPPQVNVDTAMEYRRQLDKVFAQGTPAQRKRLLRSWVEKITLAPERLEVKITYRVPEPVVKSVVAGAGFEPATFGL